MTWSDVDWTATEAVVGRIQDRIFRAAKVKRPRLEPDDGQSSCPVLRGLGSAEPGYPTAPDASGRALVPPIHAEVLMRRPPRPFTVEIKSSRRPASRRPASRRPASRRPASRRTPGPALVDRSRTEPLFQDLLLRGNQEGS